MLGPSPSSRQWSKAQRIDAGEIAGAREELRNALEAARDSDLETPTPAPLAQPNAFEEVIEDGRNGWLVDFFDSKEIAARLIQALGARDTVDYLRKAARKTIVERYALPDCLAAQLDLIDGLKSPIQ